jgi:Metallo-beta-lactamase superfamily
MSVNEDGEHEYADHREGDREFEQGAEDETQPGRKPNATRLIDAPMHGEFASDGADERSEEQPRNSKKESDDRADDRAPDRSSARTDAFRSERGSRQIHDKRNDREKAENAQRDPADALEVVDGRSEHHTRKHERHAGQGGQQYPERADQHQPNRKRPQCGVRHRVAFLLPAGSVTRCEHDAATPLISEATPAALREIPWLSPDFVTREGDLVMSVHALLVETPSLRIVVDTCVGNDKPRRMTRHIGLQTGFLQRLEAAGWRRDRVDIVVCTHLHIDHIGWNTMFEDGQWVPTFPGARYLISRREYDHWSGDFEDEEQVAG